MHWWEEAKGFIVFFQYSLEKDILSQWSMDYRGLMDSKIFVRECIFSRGRYLPSFIRV